jgi:hypothetical protein
VPQVSQPTVKPQFADPKYGFNRHVERLNGRAAMIGFLAIIAIEFATGKGLLTLLGILPS